MEYEEKIRDRKVGFNHLVPNIPSFLLSFKFKGLGIVTPSKKPIHSHADRQEETRCCFPKETKKYTTPRQQTRETNGWHRTSFCGAPKVEASKRGKIDRVGLGTRKLGTRNRRQDEKSIKNHLISAHL